MAPTREPTTAGEMAPAAEAAPVREKLPVDERAEPAQEQPDPD